MFKITSNLRLILFTFACTAAVNNSAVNSVLTLMAPRRAASFAFAYMSNYLMRIYQRCEICVDKFNMGFFPFSLLFWQRDKSIHGVKVCQCECHASLLPRPCSPVCAWFWGSNTHAHTCVYVLKVMSNGLINPLVWLQAATATATVMAAAMALVVAPHNR